VVPQPKVVEIYYKTFAMMNCHNCHRQDLHEIENKLVTQSWSMSVNGTINSFDDSGWHMAYIQPMQMQSRATSDRAAEGFLNFAG
jgi:hypothetical protein